MKGSKSILSIAIRSTTIDAAQADRRRDHARANPAQPFFFRRFEKLFEVWQNSSATFSSSFAVTHLPDLVGHCHADVFTRRNRRLRDCVGVLERVRTIRKSVPQARQN